MWLRNSIVFKVPHQISPIGKIRSNKFLLIIKLTTWIIRMLLRLSRDSSYPKGILSWIYYMNSWDQQDTAMSRDLLLRMLRQGSRWGKSSRKSRILKRFHRYLGSKPRKSAKNHVYLQRINLLVVVIKIQQLILKDLLQSSNKNVSKLLNWVKVLIKETII